MDEKCHRLSLGYSNFSSIHKEIENAKEHGYWILLEDVQLTSNSIDQLNRIIEELDKAEADHKFRLFVIASDKKSLPIEILHNSVKITLETSSSSYQSIADTLNGEEICQILRRNNSNSKLYNQIIYFVSLHGFLRTHLEYGRYGWNLQYDFDGTDLMYGIKALEMLSTQLNGIETFDELWNIIQDLAWGGRVSDVWDMRSMKIISKNVYAMCLSVVKEPTEFNPKQLLMEITKKLESFNYMSNDQEMVRKMNDVHYFLKSIETSLNGELCQIADTSTENSILNICTEINKKLPNKISSAITDGEPSPFDLVLAQEIAIVNDLIERAKSAVHSLMRILTNENLISTDLHSIRGALLNGAVPSSWSLNGGQTTELVETWLENIQKCAEFLIIWKANRLPTVICLNKLSLPRAFLISVKQLYARQYQLSLIDVDFAYEIEGRGHITCEHDDDVDVKTNNILIDGLFIEGLYIDAATWDFKNNCLSEAPHGLLLSQFSIMKMTPEEKCHQTSKSKFKVCPFDFIYFGYFDCFHINHFSNIQGAVISECLQQNASKIY